MKTRRTKIHEVDRHGRRAFRRAVTFERPDAEILLECVGETLRQFFCAGDDQLQTAKILRRHTAHVELQKRRRGQQDGDGIFSDEGAHRPGIERVGMIHHARADGGGHAQRDREAEGMEKRQDAEHAIMVREIQDVTELLKIRENVVMREHHALGFAGAAAGKNHRCQVVQSNLLFLSGHFFEQAKRREFREQK